MSLEKTKIKKGGRNCCVVGCFSRSCNNPQLSFYSFPSRPWEIERRKKWIAAVRRKSEKGQAWIPTKNSKVCSAHFEGGCKSENSNDTSYYPTIFPEVYRRKHSVNLDRGKRLEARKNKQLISSNMSTQFKETNEHQMEVGESSSHFVVENIISNDNKSTQTNLDSAISDENKKILFCWRDNVSGEASTQTNITISNPVGSKKKIIVVGLKIVETQDARVGSDNPYQPGFIGFSNIKSDVDMKRFTGINLTVFKILLKFIQPGKHGQPKYFRIVTAENRLLLFLMKMKLGLPFGVLGILFNVSLSTVSAIFKNVLKSIHENTKTWVFWPSRKVVKATTPQAFKNYPNCRGIMDCIEIRCDTPTTIEQRVLMYSSYKSDYTIKFLIVISPSGMITFVSKSYGGKSTDDFIVNDSGFINLVEPGDEIMADKDFPLIKTELLQRNCVLIMPPFADKPQFTREEAKEDYSIASERIHIKRVIQRIKIFKILEHVTSDLMDNIDDIMRVACALANCKEPVIPSKQNN